MNFENVKQWFLPGNREVTAVFDGQNRRIWRKPPDYTEPFYVENITNTNETLVISMENLDTNPTTNYLPITIEYSTDKIHWYSLGTTAWQIQLSKILTPGDKIYLRASTNTWCNGHYFNRISGMSKVGGNIMSLFYGSNFTGNETTFPTTGDYKCKYMFTSNALLLYADELLLPVKDLTGCTACYEYMFVSCSSLTTAPALPATTLSEGCYVDMFFDCTSLEVAPDLPATTLENQCYANMFASCTSLKKAPVLPAKTLTYGCYYYMFYNCTQLNYIKCLATDISASRCLDYWTGGRFSASGTFVKDANTTWPSGSSGIPSGWTIENAPVVVNP